MLQKRCSAPTCKTVRLKAFPSRSDQNRCLNRRNVARALGLLVGIHLVTLTDASFGNGLRRFSAQLGRVGQQFRASKLMSGLGSNMFKPVDTYNGSTVHPFALSLGNRPLGPQWPDNKTFDVKEKVKVYAKTGEHEPWTDLGMTGERRDDIAQAYREERQRVEETFYDYEAYLKNDIFEVPVKKVDGKKQIVPDSDNFINKNDPSSRYRVVPNKYPYLSAVPMHHLCVWDYYGKTDGEGTEKVIEHIRNGSINFGKYAGVEFPSAGKGVEIHFENPPKFCSVKGLTHVHILIIEEKNVVREPVWWSKLSNTCTVFVTNTKELGEKLFGRRRLSLTRMDRLVRAEAATAQCA